MRTAALAALCFLATAVLVDLGVFHGLDQYATEHLMPWIHPRPHRLITIRSLFLPSTSGSPFRRALDLWIYPASVFVSGAVVAALSWRARSPAWCVVWVAGNAVELAGKLIVERPALFHHGVHVTAFDHSLPSGHTIRSLLVAGAVAWTWRRGRWAYAWAASVPMVLVLLGHHAPMDCVAGALVALALLASKVDRRRVTP